MRSKVIGAGANSTGDDAQVPPYGELIGAASAQDEGHNSR
jgi:hypothetical protein